MGANGEGACSSNNDDHRLTSSSCHCLHEENKRCTADIFLCAADLTLNMKATASRVVRRERSATYCFLATLISSAPRRCILKLLPHLKQLVACRRCCWQWSGPTPCTLQKVSTLHSFEAGTLFRASRRLLRTSRRKRSHDLMRRTLRPHALSQHTSTSSRSLKELDNSLPDADFQMLPLRTTSTRSLLGVSDKVPCRTELQRLLDVRSWTSCKCIIV